MNIAVIDHIKHLNNQTYGTGEIVVKSPGRANIIGEHTDYNHGLSLPFSIERSIYLSIGKNDKGLLRLTAADLKQTIEIEISDLTFLKKGWHRYFVNVLVALGDDNRVGLDVIFGGDLPSGMGISSSSAITCGFLYGLNKCLHLGLSFDDMISIASQAENGIGLNGGIMDQTAIMKGEKGQALLIDYLSGDCKSINLNLGDHCFYLFESGQKHDLVETAYNQRRTTCEQALELIKRSETTVNSFRDVTNHQIMHHLKDDILKKRCRHVIEENRRVVTAASAIRKEDFQRLGALIFASHESLTHLYDVSTPEIDYLVSRSRDIPLVLGSRIMGGGFGGCTINLCKEELPESEILELARDYKMTTGLPLEVLKIDSGEGVSLC